MAARPRGMTLPEMLVASVLLVLVSSAFFQILVPVLQRSGKVDEHQEELQRFVLVREQLSRRLHGARLDRSASSSTELRYHLPERVETPWGRLNRVSDAEMVVWDESRAYRLKASVRGGDVVLLEKEEGFADEDRRNRILWNLGPEGEVAFDGSGLPFLRITVGGRRAGGAAWKRTFQIRVENYR